MQFIQPATFVFVGRSGCGKGTQAHLIQDLLESENRQVLYIETGKELRNFTATHDSYSAKQTKEIMGNGEFLPAFMPIWIWTNVLINQFEPGVDLILDGLARKISEAPILDSALKFYERMHIYIVHINVSRQWSLDRLLARHRSDDTREKIERRLDAYDHDVPQVLDYFRERKGYALVEVNGEQTIEQVHAEILEKISTASVC